MTDSMNATIIIPIPTIFESNKGVSQVQEKDKEEKQH
jgi:hypothetical protein